MQLREERMPHESRLMSELRTMQGRHHHMRPTASHRFDGYTSDTTAFADDDDDFTIPLHINTKSNATSPTSPPNRTSSRNYMMSKNIYTTNTNRNERPFVAVKRAHEEKYAQVFFFLIQKRKSAFYLKASRKSL